MKTYSNPKLSIVLLLSSSWMLAQGTSSQPYSEHSCALLNSSLTVSLDQILPLRIPSASQLTLPRSCQISAEAKIAEWRREDENNSEALDNRICSYRTGWIERNPGACSAGGPPPICKVDHWIQVGPARAIAAMASQERNVLDSRRSILFNAACSCKLAGLQALPSNPSESSHSSVLDRPNQYVIEPPGSIVASCSYGCPPGLSCSGGVCKVPSEQVENRKRLAENPIIESARDNVVEPLRNAAVRSAAHAAASRANTRYIGRALAIALEVSESFAGKAVAGGFELLHSTTLGTDRSLYDSIAGRAANHLKEMEELSAQMDAFQAHRPARDPSVIQADMHRVSAKLREDMQNLNVAWLGVSQGHEIQDYECPSVISWRQAQLNQSLASVVSLVP